MKHKHMSKILVQMKTLTFLHIVSQKHLNLNHFWHENEGIISWIFQSNYLIFKIKNKNENKLN